LLLENSKKNSVPRADRNWAHNPQPLDPLLFSVNSHSESVFAV